MESITNINLKANQELLEDFEGVEPGDTVKIVSEHTVSEISENRVSLPIKSIHSVTIIGGESEETESEEEDTESIA